MVFGNHESERLRNSIHFTSILMLFLLTLVLDFYLNVFSQRPTLKCLVWVMYVCRTLKLIRICWKNTRQSSVVSKYEGPNISVCDSFASD